MRKKAVQKILDARMKPKAENVRLFWSAQEHQLSSFTLLFTHWHDQRRNDRASSHHGYDRWAINGIDSRKLKGTQCYPMPLWKCGKDSCWCHTSLVSCNRLWKATGEAVDTFLVRLNGANFSIKRPTLCKWTNIVQPHAGEGGLGDKTNQKLFPSLVTWPQRKLEIKIFYFFIKCDPSEQKSTKTHIPNLK